MNIKRKENAKIEPQHKHCIVFIFFFTTELLSRKKQSEFLFIILHYRSPSFKLDLMSVYYLS